MKKLAVAGLIMGILSIGIVKAQSDFGWKQEPAKRTIQKNKNNTTPTPKNVKQTTNYSLPFMENFDDSSFPPTDWTTFVGSDGAGNNASHNWKSDSDGNSGSCAYVKWENNGGDIFEDWMVSPKIDLGSNSILSYYEKQEYGTDYGSQYYIKISTNTQTNYADFSDIESYTEGDFGTSYSLHEVDLSAYAGQSVYIAFVMINDDGDSWYVDDMFIEDHINGGTPGGELIISEVADPYDGEEGRFVELFNSGDTDVDLTKYYLAFKKNSNKVNLSGTIAAGGTFIFAHDKNDFHGCYGFNPDQWTNSNYNRINGTKAIYLLYKENNGSYTRLDTYGVPNSNGASSEWDFTKSHAVRKIGITTHQTNFNPNEWEISTAYYQYRDVTPGNHNNTYYWTGNQSNEWDDYQNWTVTSGIATIPDAGNNVVITNGAARDADLAYYQFPYYFNNLTIQNGASFTITSYDWLKVKGDIDIEGGGSFTLKSDINGAAALVTEGTISGTAAIERYFATIGGTPTNGKWHYFSPATSDLISNTFMDQWLMYWDEPATYWQYITATDEILTPGKGYGVLLKNSYGKTISMTGSLNYGDIQSPVLHSTNGAGWQGWNLVGNPYPTPIDWDVIAANLPAGIDQSIHYWDAENDQYVYYNNGNGSADSQYIPPMQGFFIHVTTDNVQFTFTEDAKTIEGAEKYYKQGGDKPYVLRHPQPKVRTNRLVISSTNPSGRADKAFLEFAEKGTSGFDPQYDVTKFFSNNDSLTELYLPYNEEKYSVNVLNTENLEGRYDLNIKYGLNDTFTLSFEGLDSFEPNQAIQLYDKQLDEYYNLRQKSNLEFYNDSQYAEDRFEIVFVDYLSVEKTVASDWLVYSSNGKLNIKPNDGEIKGTFSYEIYSAQGKLVVNEDHISSVSNKSFPLSAGIYLVKIIEGRHQTTRKLWLSK